MIIALRRRIGRRKLFGHSLTLSVCSPYSSVLDSRRAALPLREPPTFHCTLSFADLPCARRGTKRRLPSSPFAFSSRPPRLNSTIPSIALYTVPPVFIRAPLERAHSFGVEQVSLRPLDEGSCIKSGLSPHPLATTFELLSPDFRRFSAEAHRVAKSRRSLLCRRSFVPKFEACLVVRIFTPCSSPHSRDSGETWSLLVIAYDPFEPRD